MMHNPYKMRRHARRMRRHGLQPMVVINSGDHLPDLIIVMMVRWLWRYRSELGPVFLAAMMMLASWVLHTFHPQWWLGITILGGAVAATLATLGRRVGLAQVIERTYAAVVAAGTSLWLAAATATGPIVAPLPGALVIGGVLLSIPWWAHRRRRSRVRVERKLAAWPEIAEAVGLKGCRITSAFVDTWGWRARVALARGQTIEDVIAKLPAIESALGTFRGAARALPTPDDLANRLELRVLETDPHADAIPWRGPSITSITEPIELGPFEDGSPVRVLLLRRHALIGGATGSGKSGGINAMMGNLSACPDVVIWGVDLKRGMELRPWATCIERLATTPEQARALLRCAVAIVEARATMLANQGKRVWEPTPEDPALVIIIDEYAELNDEAPDTTEFTDTIARLGRAVAVTLVAATQRPTQKAMGHGAVRSQMDVRICFRVRERRDVDLILGQGTLKAGWSAHTLNAPGKFLISAPEHDVPRRARSYLVTDQAVSDAARRHASTRPTLDEASRRALDQNRPHEPSDAPTGPYGLDHGTERHRGPEAILWASLAVAPDEGVSVPDLIAATGMSRPWVYQRLRELADRGEVLQVSRGRWRASTGHVE